ncbi:hypothetical protein J6590_046665 [Homalodisca vitripennis]|nr:hypothetical protein J6590_046665 [Homalodisca vitripennis]
MRAKPTSNSRAGKSSRGNGKSNGGNPKGVVKRRKEQEQKVIPDLSVLRQPVDTSVCGLKQAVKVFETGTPELPTAISDFTLVCLTVFPWRKSAIATLKTSVWDLFLCNACD